MGSSGDLTIVEHTLSLSPRLTGSPARGGETLAANVVLSRQGGEGPALPNTDVILQASVTGGSAHTWEWKLNGNVLADVDQSQLEFRMANDRAGTYVARAQLTDQSWTPDSAPLTVALAPATLPETTPEVPAAEAPPTMNVAFAWIAGIILALIGYAAVATIDVLDDRLGLGQTDWDSLTGGQRLAATLVVPLIVLGALAVVIGMWMALVEWRGRFRDATTVVTKSVTGDDVSKVIDSIAKLRGAALVMVVGGLLMLSAAWIGGSAASPPAAEPSATVSPGQ